MDPFPATGARAQKSHLGAKLPTGGRIGPGVRRGLVPLWAMQRKALHLGAGGTVLAAPGARWRAFVLLRGAKKENGWPGATGGGPELECDDKNRPRRSCI